METYKIKFPKGKLEYELLYYMGVDWIDEKDPDQQELIRKCSNGGTVELSENEIRLLIDEVENAIDIKADHVDHEDWNALQQYHLKKFGAVLNQLINK